MQRHLLSTTDAGNTTSYTYNAAGQATSSTIPRQPGHQDYDAANYAGGGFRGNTTTMATTARPDHSDVQGGNATVFQYNAQVC